MTKLERWKPPEERTLEDKLLLQYWYKANGLIFTEVSIGGRGSGTIFPRGSKVRRIDAVRIIPSEHCTSISDIVVFKKADPGEFQEVVDGAKIEVIEIKKFLGRNVIGQVIVGADLLDMAYKPINIDQIIIFEVGDPLLEIICEKRGIYCWQPINH